MFSLRRYRTALIEVFSSIDPKIVIARVPIYGGLENTMNNCCFILFILLFVLPPREMDMSVPFKELT